MRVEDQFHVGIVADDFEATLAELTALFGYRWCEEIGGPTPVRLASGETVLPLRCVYSLGTPRLEIVRRVPGTLWEPAAGVHHLGYWSDDLTRDSAGLERAGYTAEAVRVDADGTPSFAFYRGPGGLLIELVSRTLQPGLEHCWATAPAITGRGA